MSDMVSFSADTQHFDRFHAIIAEPDLKGDLAGSVVICASMLLAVQCFLVAAFGREEAARVLKSFIDDANQSLKLS